MTLMKFVNQINVSIYDVQVRKRETYQHLEEQEKESKSANNINHFSFL